MDARDEWGRIDADGTVYVKTAEGERAVGSWQAGSPEEGLAHFERRFEELVAQVDLLGQRIESGVADPSALRDSARHLRATLETAHAVGDFGALDRRLADLTEQAAARVAAAAEARAARRADAADVLRRLCDEAETLAQSTQWKTTGERLRTLAEEWKAGVRAVDRKTAGELWRRFAAARDEFHRRRGSHFAARNDERQAAQQRKEELITEAEQLAASTDWAATAARFRDLMLAWKSAGRTAKPTEDGLWERFHAAQQEFFARRSATFAERDSALRANQESKERLLAEAETLDPAVEPAAARRRLREIQERWDAVGPVPRETKAGLEKRMASVESRMRAANDARWSAPNPQASPLVERLRESVAKLERRAARARADGRDDDAVAAETALTTQREWLAQAERS